MGNHRAGRRIVSAIPRYRLFVYPNVVSLNTTFVSILIERRDAVPLELLFSEERLHACDNTWSSFDSDCNPAWKELLVP